MWQPGPFVLTFFKYQQLRRFLIQLCASLVIEHFLDIPGDQAELDRHGDTSRAGLFALTAGDTFGGHVHGSDQVVHGWVRHRQATGCDPFLVFQGADVAEALRADVAAAVAFDAVLEFLLPEGQFFVQAHCRRSFPSMGQVHLRSGHPPWLCMDGEWLGAAAELGFVLGAFQADQGDVIQVELGMLEHLDDAAFLAAPADDGQLGVRMGVLDDLEGIGHGLFGPDCQSVQLFGMLW